MKIVLAVNAGSSSVKISVFAVDARGAAPRQLAEAQVRGLTAPPARLDYTRGADAVHHGKQVELAAADASNVQDAAFVLLLATLVDDGGLAALAAAGDVAVVVHRIVHGGDYAAPQHISPKTLHQLDRLSDLAPLHNAPALHIVRTCLARLPAAANVACFDSQFHASMPPHVATYPIDQDIARANMLRKYGFHGISYSFIARAAAKALAKPAADTNIIALHLGSGASACAIRAGRSLDTSMGLTPLAGLPGATRSGSIDPRSVSTSVSVSVSTPAQPCPAPAFCLVLSPCLLVFLLLVILLVFLLVSLLFVSLLLVFLLLFPVLVFHSSCLPSSCLPSS